MEKGEAAGPWSLVTGMGKVVGEAGVDMITGLVNQIIVGVIPSEWELSTLENCYKGKWDALESWKRKLHGTEINRSVSVDSWESYWEVDKATGGHWWYAVWFHARIWNSKTPFFHLRELQEKYLAKKKNLYFAFVDLKKAFDRECLGSLYGRFWRV